MRYPNPHERDHPQQQPDERVESGPTMDEFSFPTTPVDQDSLCSLPFPHFAASPLWFLTSSGTAEKKMADDIGRMDEALKVADAAESDSAAGGGQILPGDEERMDMLWEDFNEELRRLSCGREGEASAGGSSEPDAVLQSGVAELCCLQALREAKGGSIIQRRRSSLILILKVLKKLFLIPKDVPSRRTPLC